MRHSLRRHSLSIRVAVLNRSTLVSPEEARRVTEALLRQVRTDYAAGWEVGAEVSVGLIDPAPPDAWQLVLLDDSDQADALGYHDLTATGRPLGKVFVRSVQQSGGSWSVAASHELLEMMADPDINLAAEGADPNDPKKAAFYAYENCDPLQGDTYGIDGVIVSNFVYPEFFELNPARGARFDHLKLVDAPFTLRPNGYMSFLPIPGGAHWQQIFGDLCPPTHRMPRPGGRRYRRMEPRSRWRPSTA
jgi:hypothetical protein